MMQKQTLRIPLVGEHVEIEVFGIDPSLLGGIFMDVQKYAKKLERIFNLYDPKSELSVLNRQRRIEASKELLEVVKKALLFGDLSYGTYDVSWGRNFLQRKKGEMLSPLGCTYKDIHIHGSTISIQHQDVLIDLGSIAKGYIVDKLCDFLQSAGVGSAIVDARGDMRAFGDVSHLLSIQHPRKDAEILPFWLKDFSVATSGDYRQFKGDHSSSHILGKHDFSSITILAPKAMDADAIATCVFALPRIEAISLLQRLGNPAVLITNGGNTEILNGFDKHLENA